MVWNLTGDVKLRISRTAGDNAVVSGIFFGPAGTTAPLPPPAPTPAPAPTPVPPPPASAAFLGVDATRAGTWRGTYGNEGYAILNDVISYPAYAKVASAGASTWTWIASTTDTRALQRASGSDRLAATWYGASFTFDINLTDGATHQLAIYGVDWDSTTRAQRIDVLDASTGAVLDSRAMTSFHGGQYLLWNLRGHLLLRISRVAGDNAVVSGLFFR
jgi:hypothetical protein